MRTSFLLKFPARTKSAAKASVVVFSAAGAATILYSKPDPLQFPILHGAVRSSRSFFTIAATVLDYKYSLRGLLEHSDEYHRVRGEVNLRSAERILRLCELNRGFYVKAGQFVAALRAVPKEYSSTLSSLQDQTAPYPFRAIKEVLVQNFGTELSEIFISFDEQPVAAASIAQVHRAVLKDNQDVAVKVQYPGLEKQMKYDLRTMSILSEIVTWILSCMTGRIVSFSNVDKTPHGTFKFYGILSEKVMSCFQNIGLDGFYQNLPNPLLLNLARNSERASLNFKGSRTVRVPHVYWDLTTTKVLTMQFCEGKKVDSLEFMKLKGINPSKVAEALSEMVAEMIFVHGFLHGDLHPGNILVSEEGQNGFSLVLLDHGIYKELDEAFRVNYCELWKALIFMDSNKIQQLGEQMGGGKYSRYLPVMFTGRTLNSKSALGRGMSAEERNYLKQELKSLKMEDISSFMESLPPDFLAVLRADGLLRSLISKLGAPHRIRLRAYAKHAFHGISTNKTLESGVTMRTLYSRMERRVKDIQLVLLLDLLESIFVVAELSRRLRTALVSTGFLLGNFLSGLLRIKNST